MKYYLTCRVIALNTNMNKSFFKYLSIYSFSTFDKKTSSSDQMLEFLIIFFTFSLELSLWNGVTSKRMRLTLANPPSLTTVSDTSPTALISINYYMSHPPIHPVILAFNIGWCVYFLGLLTNRRNHYSWFSEYPFDLSTNVLP